MSFGYSSLVRFMFGKVRKCSGKQVVQNKRITVSTDSPWKTIATDIYSCAIVKFMTSYLNKKLQILMYWWQSLMNISEKGISISTSMNLKFKFAK